MSCPSNSTLPACGRVCPVMRLNSVVLPEPFGPMTACRLPPRNLERDVVDGVDPAERPVEPDGPQDHIPRRFTHDALRMRARRRAATDMTSPHRPCGNARTHTTKIAPTNSCQDANSRLNVLSSSR